MATTALLLRDKTAREIREMLPDPNTLDVVAVPGKVRRELFSAMKQHDPVNLAELCNAVGATSANILRDQYFQFAKVLNFPINEWLAREQDALDKIAEKRHGVARAQKARQMGAAREAKSKLAIATELLESLGYAWHGTSNKFVKLLKSDTDWG